MSDDFFAENLRQTNKKRFAVKTRVAAEMNVNRLKSLEKTMLNELEFVLQRRFENFGDERRNAAARFR